MDLNEEEQKTLQKFRTNMSDLLQPRHGDRFLLRWLRARDFNLREAEKMLREDFKLRKKLKADTLVRDYELHEIMKSYVPTVFLGFSKMGHLVRFCDVGSVDAKGFIKSMTLQDMMLNILWLLEWDRETLEQHNKETGNEVYTNIYIVDYSKVRFHQWCDREVFHHCIMFAQKYQNHYPETLHAIFALNAPSVIVYLYNIIARPFIAENVWEKIKLYSPGNDGYKEELFSLVPKEMVPAYLGGDRYAPKGDPTCDGLVHRKPKIPSSFYITDQMTLKLDDPKVHKQVVCERSFFKIEKDIAVSGMVLSWEFQTKDNNIKFGLFYKQPQINCDKNTESEMQELMPVESTESNIMVEQGQCVCVKEGTYILFFDNRHSWFRSKHLYYKVEVLKPDTTIGE